MHHGHQGTSLMPIWLENSKSDKWRRNEMGEKAIPNVEATPAAVALIRIIKEKGADT